MYIRPTFLPEATFLLGPTELNPQLPRYGRTIRTYERTTLRIATEARSIHNIKVAA
jgi:hypothetical protein